MSNLPFYTQDAWVRVEEGANAKGNATDNLYTLAGSRHPLLFSSPLVNRSLAFEWSWVLHTVGAASKRVSNRAESIVHTVLNAYTTCFKSAEGS